MSKLSLIDKLGVLINLSVSSTPYVIALIVLLIFGILLSFTNKKNEKIHKALYFIMTAVIIGLLIASYHSSLGNMFNYMMNNFFIAVYFPTIAIYLAAMIAMNIIVWVSIFSFKSSKQIRTLNISIYVIMNYLMALLLKVINTNKLDIFDQASLYGNKDATALIELSSLVFVVWVIFLILYKLILIYIRKDYKPRVKRIIVRKEIKKLPENYEPTVVPNYIYGQVPHKETLVIDTTEKTEEEILLERFSKQFTLEDYKLFSRLLKEEQDRKNNKKVDFIAAQDKVTTKKKNNKKQVKENNKIVDFLNISDYGKVTKNNKQQEIVVSSANTLEEEDSYRAQQKQEIIRMEEERRELLKQEQEKQRLLEEQKKQEEERKRQIELAEEEARRLQIEEQQREEQELEMLLQQTLAEKEREERKLSELEMLYK